MCGPWLWLVAWFLACCTAIALYLIYATMVKRS